MSDRIEITKFDLMLFPWILEKKNEINFVIFCFFLYKNRDETFIRRCIFIFVLDNCWPEFLFAM